MITVVIYINGNPIFARTAVNQNKIREKDGTTKYKVDTGSIIWHKRENGAVPLVKMMLDTIKE